MLFQDTALQTRQFIHGQKYGTISKWQLSYATHQMAD